MSERITPAMVTSATLNDLNASLGALTRTTDELSSGKKILEPSDNPYGASQVIDLQSQLEGLSSYESNAQDGISWENTASTAMSSIGQAAEAKSTPQAATICRHGKAQPHLPLELEEARTAVLSATSSCGGASMMTISLSRLARSISP